MLLEILAVGALCAAVVIGCVVFTVLEKQREKEECCEDWASGIKKLNGPILLAQARNPHLSQTPEFQFKPFKFCPWCGAERP